MLQYVHPGLPPELHGDDPGRHPAGKVGVSVLRAARLDPRPDCPSLHCWKRDRPQKAHRSPSPVLPERPWCPPRRPGSCRDGRWRLCQPLCSPRPRKRRPKRVFQGKKAEAPSPHHLSHHHNNNCSHYCHHQSNSSLVLDRSRPHSGHLALAQAAKAAAAVVIAAFLGSQCSPAGLGLAWAGPCISPAVSAGSRARLVVARLPKVPDQAGGRRCVAQCCGHPHGA